ncbi:TPA: hypothetical protein HA278_03825 [Candidatus Woesearchaeota archaeon]|nr:hypothetical protein [Candidatus Woesearchaeota archaeon]
MNNVKEGHKNSQSYANTRKTGKEQYYTNSEVVDYCLDIVQKHVNLSGKNILEPAGGTGEFIKGFQRIGIPDNLISSYDIEPKHPMVELGNYLETSFVDEYVSITNPPFGRASSLAKQFFNHAANHSSHICYLIPKAWRKWSTMNSLDPYFHLIADEPVPQNCFYLSDGSTKKNNVLQTVFQIWEKRDYKRQKIVIPDHGLIKKIRPWKDKTVNGANVQLIVFGWSCGKVIEIESPTKSVTTSMYLNIRDPEVIQALKEIDFSKHYKNVSTVYSLSLPEINYELNNYFGLKNWQF